MTTRERVVEEALRWEGTPYHSHARIIGVGVDCANMPAAVYEAAGLVPHLSPRYSNEWHMHRNEEVYLEWVTPHAREIDPSLARAGDFVIWRFGRTFSHGAIVIDPPIVLHAAIGPGAVVRADMTRDIDLLSRPRRAFTLWDDC